MGANTRDLRVGDGLIFSLVHGKANHTGVYVGNGMFIHHVYKRFSSEEALVDKWKSRLLSIVRHPEVHKKNSIAIPRKNLIDHLPRNIRAKLITAP
jgi:cell wall-associated NlpC family hydrolase